MPSEPSSDQRPQRMGASAHRPQAILERLLALLTEDLGPEDRIAIEREIRSWERRVGELESPSPT